MLAKFVPKDRLKSLDPQKIEAYLKELKKKRH